MSATSCLLTEEQFLCCICLDVFTLPVTIPCGHNFCKSCITQHWNVNRVHCQCPMCKKHFKTRPELTVNTFISEMAAEFRQSAGNKGSRGSEIQVAKPGDVPCDICSGTKLKALKSCLTCFASYCGVHVDPHLTAGPLKRHSLVDPIANIEDRVCSKHKKPLELFCKTDQTCMCSLCAVSEHVVHNIVSLKDEYEAKSAELERAEAEIQHMIQERRLKIQQIERLKTHSKEDAEREIADGVQIFTALMQTAERRLNELIEGIEERQKSTEEQADRLITELEQEISVLTTRTAEVQQLSRTQDHLLLLQSFTSMNAAPCTKNWTEVRVRLPSYEGTVVKAVDELEEMLSRGKQKLLHGARLNRVQHYAADVTLEPHTANPWLILSDDGKQVSCGEVRRDLPDNQERFSLYANVLARQSFSSGRFYYEVQVAGKTDWTLGVTKRSVNRKGIIPLSPVNGYWAVGLRNRNQYLTLTCPVVGLSLTAGPQRVGVFVSYEEGLVSFYDVDAAVHLYSFTGCCFTGELSPFFSPGLHHGGLNAAPLIISPVSLADQI
ncbi:E3 ubiquitin-protein ligase TRIM39-like [Seriola lalandi dorsalis]|uniref:E3 ubiquitin-protein ligase TRIM39-like n=1 Tax=Seriola lalandi dorsalis TaxID=1841481 RepID=UPI000C6F92AF|nr:E3 ubiquitin-protein ligase TRIM39-like [Seriola lalandi dorsalis]XP_023261452.1 E3 ubiquitin-protein ligase TRIM39-like [Seriola lalandi dorsalis]XP_056248444.1 E3 ubiquitin-protein ligase TRIM39-like [Seriola aureovittata]XP_056248445.1 E3 ubiquitin-protein ligase TRIM39-like [Seriola aureovittata]